MATSEKGVATGADLDNAARRRNAPSTSPNGGAVDRVELDEKKTQIKKVCQSITCPGSICRGAVKTHCHSLY